ncbi:MAG: Ig-like domain-containing protein [Oryzomonas sp.]|uniref:beta strand repeat-containing protein n=1 Tax=Oryzomonas sp. TaxID=2855186 RepID=UPI002844EDB2|nr:Ig-like domain-containing protein [Oryzomonas sp.]MDR3578341.1 Ig-like domain-containing protein [Oryzomonas sp.]
MKKTILWSILAFMSFIVYGCGSGDFFTGTTISGVASKGPITGASVAIFAVTTSGHRGISLATAQTQADGKFSANIGSYTGAIFATMSGSSASYTDETSNATTPLGTTKLRAATVITAGGSYNLAITPFTELACQLSYNPNTATFTNITANNTQVSTSFLLPNIITTLPANILKTASAVTNPDTINYSLALAAFSELIYNSGSPITIAAGVSQLSTAITNNNGNVSTVWSPAVSSLASNTNIQAGLTNVPVNIAFSSPTYSAIISQPITITAKVTKFDGTPVASGTTVTFTASSGSLGTLTATDVNGNATVVLTPSAIGTTTVNATATVSGVTVSTKTAASVTVVKNPNDPGSVTLSSSASSAVVGQTMTLTANVGVVGGGPSNVTPGSPPAVGTPVTFTIVHGTGTLGTPTTTDANGNATVTLTSATAGNITLSASAGTSPVVTSNPITVAFTPNPAAPATVTVSASSTSSPADGVTPITFTITVKNYAGTALLNVPLAIGNSGVGTLGTAPATTGNTGSAQITLTSSTAGPATVTASATASGVTATGTAQVNFTAFTRPTTAIVKVLTSGTLASGTKIGSIQADVTYTTTKGLTPTSAVASGLGTASGILFEQNLNYAVGDVRLGLASTAGITTGEFATVTFTIPASGTTLPVSGDFAITGASVTDTNGATLAGTISVISTVTFQ